ncbi:MAG: carbamoyltransferase HypF, partial [Candidatus Electrothrix sp. ATG2]|nr:carbamoyltransferase HypF [Candidatus Electrothrix sp. ATG2]
SGSVPLTSSCGRLFDAVAALLGLCVQNVYEGQAALRLESLTRPGIRGQYPFIVERKHDPVQISFAPTLAAILADLNKGIEKTIISTRFHKTVSAAVVAVCVHLREQRRIENVVLSGGVFQNAFLLQHVCTELAGQGFAVFHHCRVPPNDGGLALGQAAVALAQYNKNARSITPG